MQILSIVLSSLLLIGQSSGQVVISTTRIRGTSVSFASLGPETYDTAVFAIPGQETTVEDMTLGVFTAVTNGGCSNRTKVFTVDFGDTSYNLLDRQLIGELELNDVMDGMVKKFGKGRKVVLAGFSKGAQAIQRKIEGNLTSLGYSLVHKVQGQRKFLIGCASSWTFLDRNVEWKYGLNNFPSKFDLEAIVPLVQTNEYLIACGSKDNGSSDNSEEALAQGAGRVERAKSLMNNLVNNGVKVSMKMANGVGHNAGKVFEGTAGEYICS
ncbi:hypothetical protein BC833DRAFT_566114 [Globomyces pollinis-pini]|nr:hypothetical protein BC833DRAFT_566114 [Globomyces pollinis-pini]